MSLELGNLLGAAANVTAALQDDQKSLKSFLTTVNDFGVQVKNNFEVNFSGLEDITFFVHSIQLPGLHQNFTQIYYDGNRVDIPINHEYDHEFSLVVLNDAQGYIYSALTEFLANTSSNVLANSGYTMVLKAQNGNDKYPGMTITLNGVRIEQVEGLSFGQNDNDVQTFNVSGKLIDFSVTPGKLGKVANWLGAVNNIIG